METPAGAIYHVARDGQVIGAFSFPTLAAKFKDGSVKPTDHYLIEGTSEWKLIAELKLQFADHERQLKAEADRARNRAAAEERERVLAEERRKNEETLRKANQERELRMAEAEKERREAERRKEAAWTCGTCGKQFADAKRTGDGKGEIESSLMCLVGSMFCGFIAWQFLKASFGAAFENLSANNSGDGYITGFYLFLAGALALAWGSVRSLIIGGVAMGMHTYHGRKSSCPHCGSSDFTETKFD